MLQTSLALSPLPVVIGANGNSPIGEHLSFIVMGFLFVVFVLAALSFVTSIIGIGFQKSAPTDPAPAPSAPPAAPAAPKQADEAASVFPGHENPEHLPAVIATAAHVALQGRPHRIVAIKGAGQNWAQEGRRSIFTSHKVR